MKKYITLLIATCLATIAIFWAGFASLASDIDDARYSGVVRISSNSTSSLSNICVTFDVPSEQLVSYLGVEDDFSNTAIRTNSGTDATYQPTENSTTPWSVFVSWIGAGSSLDYPFFSGGGDMSSDRSYFPGNDGLEVEDAPALEPGTAFMVRFIDTFINPNASDNAVSKNGALRVATGSGNTTTTLLEDNDTSPTGTDDPSSAWTNDGNAIDGSTGTAATISLLVSHTWSGYLEETFTPTGVSSIRTYVDIFGTTTEQISLDIWNMSTEAWENVYEGTVDDAAWVEYDLPSIVISNAARLKIYHTQGSSQTANIYEVQFTRGAEVSQEGTAGEYDYYTLQADFPFVSQAFGVAGNITPRTFLLGFNAPLPQPECNATSFTTIDSNGHTCTVSGASWDPNTGYSFDGINDIITAPIAASMVSNNGSWRGWLRYTTADADERILDTDSPGWEYGAAILRTSSSGGGKLMFSLDDGAGFHSIYSNSALNDGVWHHVVVTFGSPGMKMYVDGILQSDTDPYTGGTAVVSTSFGMGARATGANWWTGDLSGIRIYQGNMTWEQVTQDLNATKDFYLGTGDIRTISTLISVADTSSNITIGGPSATPYIGGIEWWVNDVLQASWIPGVESTFIDQTGNGNDALASFRNEGSSEDVSAELISYGPITQARAASIALGSAGEILEDAPEEPGGFYYPTEEISLFFAPFVNNLLDFFNIPRELAWYTVAFLIIGYAGYLSYKNNNSILLTSGVMWAIMFLFACINVYGGWVLLYWSCDIFGINIMAKHYGW